MKNRPILIIMGEPYSVFLELIFKVFKSDFITKVKRPIVLIGSKKLLQGQMNILGYKFKVKTMLPAEIKKSINLYKTINLIDVNFDHKKSFDQISKKSNKYIKDCFSVAMNLINRDNKISLINGPISKKHFLKGKSLGITEYLAKKTIKNDNVAMLIFNQKLAVSPITTHLALKDVHKKISKEKIYNHINLIVDFYKKNFKKKPKIAITGLNPHCESNFKNCEEDSTIIPAIKNLKMKRIKVEGPFPADTIFMQENLRKFDVIIGMYHDQVLTPMKALFGFNAINITLGLPFIRISPDHGPNYSMLGKNLSNPQSLVEAIKFLEK